MPRSIRIELPATRTPVVQTIGQVLGRQVESRCGAGVTTEGEADQVVMLEIRPDIGREGFEIASAGQDAIRVTGNDERGLLYGVGKLLRMSRCRQGEFIPGAWTGVDVPEKDVRGAYFATHYRNFYHAAPIEKIERYLEDLALWGVNTLVAWFDMRSYSGIADADAQEMIARLRAILQAGRNLGMSLGMVVLANEAYANSPEELRAEPPVGRGHGGVELCPNRPGAVELMLKQFEEEFDAFSDMGLNHLWIWPYDTGGCGCRRCAPWGANGFLYMAEKISKLFHRFFPDGAVTLSTWLFDRRTNQGEWEGLAKAFEKPPDWVDYIMAGSTEAAFPEYPLRHGVPGGLPLLTFPEISMYDMTQWGGFGANPLPNRLQKIWDSVGTRVAGGIPYSEGIFDDINKAVVNRHHWNSSGAADTVREYAAFEFSPDVAGDVLSAVALMEKNNRHHLTLSKDGGEFGQCEIAHPDCAEECHALMASAGRRLTPRARNSWRWQMLLLRAQLDLELARSRGRHTDRVEDLLQQLARLRHAEDAEFFLAPPTRESILSLKNRRLKEGGVWWE